jgi:hypothetical protein
VATKTADQLDLQALHRVRERLVSQRTGIINQIRASSWRPTLATWAFVVPPRPRRRCFAASRLCGMSGPVFGLKRAIDEQSIRAGVRSIEHGQLVSEETVAIMAERGTWWSLQPFLLSDEVVAALNPAQRARSSCRWPRGPTVPTPSPPSTG